MAKWKSQVTVCATPLLETCNNASLQRTITPHWSEKWIALSHVADLTLILSNQAWGSDMARMLTFLTLLIYIVLLLVYTSFLNESASILIKLQLYEVVFICFFSVVPSNPAVFCRECFFLLQ